MIESVEALRRDDHHRAPTGRKDLNENNSQSNQSQRIQINYGKDRLHLQSRREDANGRK